MAIFGIMITATGIALSGYAFGLFDGEIAPARHALDANGNDREVAELHLAVLGVARAQQCLRPVVLGAVGQDFRG